MYGQKEKIDLLKILITIIHNIDDNTVSADPTLTHEKTIFDFNWNINPKNASKKQTIVAELFQVIGIPTYMSQAFYVKRYDSKNELFLSCLNYLDAQGPDSNFIYKTIEQKMKTKKRLWTDITTSELDEATDNETSKWKAITKKWKPM